MQTSKLLIITTSSKQLFSTLNPLGTKTPNKQHQFVLKIWALSNSIYLPTQNPKKVTSMISSPIHKKY